MNVGRGSSLALAVVAGDGDFENYYCLGFVVG